MGIMDTETTLGTQRAERRSVSFFTLLRTLTGDTKTLIRQEVQLAKTEISEKISMMGRNAVSLAIGGFVAYAGLIVFLIGLGWLIAWAFTQAGLAPFLSAFLGLGIIGLLVVATGTILLMGAIKRFSKESIKPQRTITTLQELKSGQPAAPENREEQSQESPSSDELEQKVQETEARLGADLDEVGRRLSPKHIKAQVTSNIQARPYRAGAIAMAAGFITAFLLKRKWGRAQAAA